MKKLALLVFVTSTTFLMAHGGGCGCGKKKTEAAPEAEKKTPCVGDKCPVQPKPAVQPAQVVTPVSNPNS